MDRITTGIFIFAGLCVVLAIIVWVIEFMVKEPPPEE